MSKVSIAEFRRRFPVGTEYIGEILNAARPEMRVTRRRIETINGGGMKSLMLDGPKVGECIYLQGWSDISIDEREGSYYFTNTDLGVEFFKATLLDDATPWKK